MSVQNLVSKIYSARFQGYLSINISISLRFCRFLNIFSINGRETDLAHGKGATFMWKHEHGWIPAVIFYLTIHSEITSRAASYGINKVSFVLSGHPDY